MRERDPHTDDRLGRRLGVTWFLAAGFLACALAVGLLVGTASVDTFRRERSRAELQLEAAATAEAEYEAELVPEVQALIDNLVTAPEVAAFDAPGCGALFAGLASGVVGAHIHLVGPSGRELCSIDDPGVGRADYPLGAWFEEGSAASSTEWRPPGRDALTGRTAVEVTTPVPGPEGPAGVLLVVLDSSAEELEPAPGTPSDTVLLATDPGRRLVLAASSTLPEAGRPALLAALRSLRPGATATVKLPSGERWLFTDREVDGLGWHSLAGRPLSAALAEARSSRNQLVGLGAGTVLLVALLGFVLHRHLARPVRRLGAVVEASWRGDAPPAAVAGLREVASLAQRFNALTDERRAREADLRWRATHDPLTGLANRAAVGDQMTAALNAPGPRDLAVLFLDLDRFKLVNDTYGHPVGDRLLRDLAGRLAAVVGDSGTVARFGGDEFVVFVTGLAAEDVALLGQRLLDAVRRPLEADGHSFVLSGCVGACLARPLETADDLIRNADIAMYSAKAQGTGRVAFFDKEMRHRTVRRHTLEQELTRALEDGALEMHYQPVVDVASGRITGAEALMRWPHPERGMVSPGEFIPVAEESGLIVELGAWALRQAMAEARRWQDLTPGGLPVAVNLAAAQLASGGLVAEVGAALQAAGLPASLLCVEVTESGVLGDPEMAAGLLRSLQEMGVTVAIDDFGTGYSSLSYLQQLPLDIIKIDRCFVERVDLDGASAQIVRSVIDLGHALGLTIVGEGVETARQLACLRRAGCDRAQGYLLARPQPASGIEALLAAGGVLPVDQLVPLA